MQLQILIVLINLWHLHKTYKNKLTERLSLSSFVLYFTLFVLCVVIVCRLFALSLCCVNFGLINISILLPLKKHQPLSGVTFISCNNRVHVREPVIYVKCLVFLF